MEKYFSSIQKRFILVMIILMYLIINQSSIKCQDNSNQKDTSYNNIGVNLYSNYSFNGKNTNKFLSLGLNIENIIGEKNRVYFSTLYDISVYGGFDGAKDFYMLNLDVGLRFSATGNEQLRLYFDILSGMSQLKSPIADNIYFGNNSKISMGIEYLNFGIEFSAMYINTEETPIVLNNIGLKINLK